VAIYVNNLGNVLGDLGHHAGAKAAIDLPGNMTELSRETTVS
jgi:hypothetical protein